LQYRIYLCISNGCRRFNFWVISGSWAIVMAKRIWNFSLSTPYLFFNPHLSIFVFVYKNFITCFSKSFLIQIRKTHSKIFFQIKKIRKARCEIFIRGLKWKPEETREWKEKNSTICGVYEDLQIVSTKKKRRFTKTSSKKTNEAQTLKLLN
jgi:hypothetical protein